MTGKFIAPTKCPKCSGVMQEGLKFGKDLAQLAEDHVIEEKDLMREYWQKTEAAKGKFLGREYEGKRRLGLRLPVATYRCVDCGYLEAYA